MIKKIIAVSSLLGLLIGGFATATTTSVINMSATPALTISFSLTPDTPINFGTFAMGVDVNSDSVGGTKTITNTGSVALKFSVKGTNACDSTKPQPPEPNSVCWGLVLARGGMNYGLQAKLGAVTPVNYAIAYVAIGNLAKGANVAYDTIFQAPQDSETFGNSYTWTSTLFAEQL